MAVGRISGPLLEENLLREKDIAFNNNLLYINVTNGRIGVGTSTPTTKLDIDGAIKSSSIETLSATVENIIIQSNNITAITGDVIITAATTQDNIILNNNIQVSDTFSITTATENGILTIDGGLLVTGPAEIAEINGGTYGN